ncbi:MAG: MBL fold metallo-hydrolase [Patescibacteria group bacterium]
MQISWHGLSCFEILVKTTTAESTIVIDPYSNTTGLRFPRTMSAQCVCVSHNDEDANNIGSVDGHPFIINQPGEFEVADVFVFSTLTKTKGNIDNLIFRIEAEKMHIAHLGALDRELTDAELQDLENIDILMIPVGGGRVMAPKTALTVISQIEPRVIIPMTHNIANVKEKLGGVDVFCKELGACRVEQLNKYKVARKDLPEEEMVIMVLSK